MRLDYPRICLSVLLGLAACRSPEPAPTAEPAPRSSRLQRLVFEDPGGQGPADTKIRSLQASVKRHPKKVDSWILLGRAFVQKARQASEPGFYNNANACARHALDLRPNYSLALDLQAMVLMNQHRFGEARALTERVLKTQPDDMLALGTLADAALELGEAAVALKAVEHMSGLKPSLPTYARVAHLRWLHGDIAGAKAAYALAMDCGRGAKDLEPLAWVISEAAQVFLKEGDLEGAQAGFQRALNAFPGYPAAERGLGQVAMAEGRWHDAADHLQQSFERGALAETAWLWFEAASKAGRTKQARVAQDKAIKLGRHGEGRVLAAMFATQGRGLGEAADKIEGELKTRGDHLTHGIHGFVRYRQGDLRSARAALDEALKLGTPEPWLWAQDGLLKLAEGDAEGAKSRLRQALAAKGALPPSVTAELQSALDS